MATDTKAGQALGLHLVLRDEVGERPTQPPSLLGTWSVGSEASDRGQTHLTLWVPGCLPFKDVKDGKLH